MEQCDVERIIPKKEFCSANRMNPKDKFYGYYVIDYCGKSREERIKTGIKEIRAEKAQEVSSCEFTFLQICNMHKNIKVKQEVQTSWRLLGVIA